MIGRAAALTNLGDKDRAFRAKKQAFGSFFSLFPVSLHVDATEVAAAANPVFWQEDGSCMSGNGFLRLLFRLEIRRHGDVGKKPPFVTRVASRAHPLAGCRGAATEAARSAGKGRFGGNVETRISPAVTSPGNTTAWGRRKKPPFVKGRFGGNVETRISPAVTSPGNTTAWGRRRNPTARGSCSPRSGGKAP